MADYLEDLGDDMDNLLGDDDPSFFDDLADLGIDPRTVKAPTRQQRVAVKRAAVQARSIRELKSALPGSQAQGYRKWPLPIATGFFSAATLATQLFVVNTQKLYRTKRVFADLARTGATATGLLTITQMAMGTMPQQAVLGPLPFSMFKAEAVDAEVNFDPIEPGIDCTFAVTCSVLPGGTDRIDFSIAMLGMTLR